MKTRNDESGVFVVARRKTVGELPSSNDNSRVTSTLANTMERRSIGPAPARLLAKLKIEQWTNAWQPQRPPRNGARGRFDFADSDGSYALTWRYLNKLSIALKAIGLAPGESRGVGDAHATGKPAPEGDQQKLKVRRSVEGDKANIQFSISLFLLPFSFSATECDSLQAGRNFGFYLRYASTV